MAPSDPYSYRGIYITSVLSKVAERHLGAPLLNFFAEKHSFGQRQWAYQKRRSSRDLVTLLMCSWLFAVFNGYCIAAYLSDIAGAFDRVFTPFLLYKLQQMGINEDYIGFLKDFLSERIGYVCLDGVQSLPMQLANMVFQGTVLGPPLWNTYFADV